MKVKELINKLKKVDQNAEFRIETESPSEITLDPIWLKTEFDLEDNYQSFVILVVVNKNR